MRLFNPDEGRNVIPLGDGGRACHVDVDDDAADDPAALATPSVADRLFGAVIEFGACLSPLSLSFGANCIVSELNGAPI